MSLLDLFREQQTKTASQNNDEFRKQAANMYELGQNIALAQLKKAAEEVSGNGEGGEKNKEEMTDEEYAAKRKAELVQEMKDNPEKQKEIEKEVTNS